jgi:hypothetical protein
VPGVVSFIHGLIIDRLMAAASIMPLQVWEPIHHDWPRQLALPVIIQPAE